MVEIHTRTGTVWTDTKPAPAPLDRVQDLVNTSSRLHGSDDLATVDSAVAALAGRGLLDPGDHLTDTGRQRLVATREALRAVLRAHGGAADADAAAALTDIMAAGRLRVRFAADGHPTLTADDSGNPADRVIARVGAAIAAAAADGTWQRLKTCGNPACGWAFYDGSRNRAGRWCDMNVCGAREKMRAYRRRRTGAPDSGQPPGATT